MEFGPWRLPASYCDETTGSGLGIWFSSTVPLPISDLSSKDRLRDMVSANFETPVVATVG
jgi:hypothetical protein